MVPKIAIIGGSGFYELPGISEITRFLPKTKYGYPSDYITIGTYKGRRVAFLPRHGRKHTLPPHKVPYKANAAALREIGVENIVATCISGSLNKEIKPGDFVIPDQFVDFTWGRDDYSKFDRGFVHLPMAQPYCSRLSKIVADACSNLGVPTHLGGTVVVIQGPRFSTLAESSFFIANGWDIVNMTQYPECYFAREFGMCYAACAAITDYNPGIGKDLQINPSKMGEVLKIFNRNVFRLKELSLVVVSAGEERRHCECASSLVEEYYRQTKKKSKK